MSARDIEGRVIALRGVIDRVDEIRFWSKVEIIDDENSCWRWIGGIHRDGYGSYAWGADRPPFNKSSKAVGAHRVAHLLATGEVPVVVRHTCDNPPCVRPKHLIGGTHADNSRDRVERGRVRVGNRKVSDQDVVEIRELFVQGATDEYISGRFGITADHAINIAAGRSWKNVGGPITIHPASSEEVVGRLSPDDVIALVTRVTAGDGIEAVGRDFCLNSHAVLGIMSGTYWSEVTGIIPRFS